MPGWLGVGTFCILLFSFALASGVGIRYSRLERRTFLGILGCATQEAKKQEFTEVSGIGERLKDITAQAHGASLAAAHMGNIAYAYQHTKTVLERAEKIKNLLSKIGAGNAVCKETTANVVLRRPCGNQPQTPRNAANSEIFLRFDQVGRRKPRYRARKIVDFDINLVELYPVPRRTKMKFTGREHRGFRYDLLLPTSWNSTQPSSRR